jgi:hypothetical protein
VTEAMVTESSKDSWLSHFKIALIALEREYEDRVQKALNELREVYESQMRESKEGFNKKYEKKVRGKKVHKNFQEKERMPYKAVIFNMLKFF